MKPGKKAGAAAPPGEGVLLGCPAYELAERAADAGTRRLILTGDIDARAAARLLAFMEEQGGMEKKGAEEPALVELDLGEAELLDGVSVARMVDLIRLLLDAAERVRVIGAPQLLAHTLYRAAMLEGDARLALIDPREEEGVSS